MKHIPTLSGVVTQRLVSLPLVLGLLSVLWSTVFSPIDTVSAEPKRGYCVCVYPKGGNSGCYDCPPGVNCASCTPSSCQCDATGE